MRKEESLYSKIATFYFVFTLIGYPLITTIFLPLLGGEPGDVSVSRIVTIPYRAFILALSLYLIFWKKSNQSDFASHSSEFIVFLFFWAIYLLRIIWDIYVRTDAVSGLFVDTIMYYVPLITLPVLFATYRARLDIDFNKAHFYLCILGLMFIAVLIFQSPDLINRSETLEDRMGANIAMGSIGLGQICVVTFISFITFFVQKSCGWTFKMVLLLGSILSVFLLLRSGCRGPIFQIVVVTIIYISFRRHDFFAALVFSLLLILFVYLQRENLMNLLKEISIVSYNRLSSFLDDGDMSGRDIYYDIAVKNFWESPIFGKTFLVNGRIYAHNYFLDSFMALGIIGGFCYIFISLCLLKKILRNLSYNSINSWIFLISLQLFLAGLTSGCFYTDTQYSQFLILLFSCPYIYNTYQKIDN